MASENVEVQHSESRGSGNEPQRESSESRQGLERSQQSSPSVRRDWFGSSPSSLMRRLNRDMDRMYRAIFGPSISRWAEFPDWLSGAGETGFWPEIEVSHAGDKFIVKADVPGLKKDDVTVEVRDNELCISGERRSESEQKEGKYYRTERSYGTFSRTIPLPENAKSDTAAATFENGVLKVEMDAPSSQRQGRRIDVREGSPH